MKKLLKRGLYVLAGLLVFVLLLAGATQTKIFRDRLREVALSNLASVLDADVRLGEIQGNLVSGFSVDSVSLSAQGRTILSADQLDFRYNIFAIPGRTISFSKITIIHPVISLVRGRDGVWNIARILRPSRPDTTRGGPFDWVIALDRFELRGGTLALTDSGSLSSPDHPLPDTATFEYHSFTLRDFSVVLAASFKKDEKRLIISSFSFVCPQPRFRLRNLSGEFVVARDECRVNNLQLITDGTDIRMDALMRDFDLFGGLSLARLKKNPVKLDIRAREVDFSELSKFIPQLDFLHGSASMNLEASGEFGDLAVRKLEFRHGTTELFLRGTVYNLHDPGNLYLNVKLTESRVAPQDALALMPSFNLPDLSFLGPSTVNMEFEGRPLDFRTKFLAETAAGDVSADCALRIGGPPTLQYSGTMLFRNLDLSGLLDNQAYKSQLNGSVRIEGKGTSIATLAGTLNVEIDTSIFGGLPVGASKIALEAGGRRLSGTSLLALGRMTSALSVELNEPAGAPPTFSVDGGVASLNLQDFLRDASYNSSLTLQLHARGTGLTLAALGGDATLDLSSSRYRDYEISSGAVRVALDQHDPRQKSLKLESNIADFSLTGSYDLGSLPRLIAFEVQNMRVALGEKFSAVDSALGAGVDRRKLATLRESLSDTGEGLDAAFSLNVKDLDPLSKVTGGAGFTGTGTLAGHIAGSVNDLALRATLKVDEFSYGTVDAGTLIQKGDVEFTIASLRPAGTIRDMNVHLDAGAASLNINRSELDSLAVALGYRNEHATYSARTIMNGDSRFDAEGEADVFEDSIACVVRRLVCGYRDFVWQADEGALVGINDVGVTFRDFVMRRDSQSVAFDGKLEVDGSFGGVVSGHRIDLDDLRYVIPQERRVSRRQLYGGVAEFVVSAGGTLGAPEYTATVRADDITYRSAPFGSLQADLKYSGMMMDVLLNGGGKVRKDQPSSGITVTGRIPVDFRLSRTGEETPEQPMNITIRTDGFQMGILDAFLPTFNDLTGILKCNVSVAGTPSEPSYQGTISISDCRFLFVPNNIYYTVDATFRPDGERIYVEDALIRNVAEDNPPGRSGEVHLRGDLSLKDFTPGDFNLRATGQLLVVKETTLKSSLSVYGNLFVEIGPDGLSFTGSLDRSLLKGFVLIRNSSLVFPPTRAVAAQQAVFTVPVALVNDTAKATVRDTLSASARYFLRDGGGTAKDGREDRDFLRTKSFIDGVRYDLEVETTGGNTEIRMEFNPATKEELVATLDGRVTITEDGTNWFGDMKVNRAYYNFFKRFDATGTLSFTGDLMNPELNITATYQGTRQTRDTTGTELSEKVIVMLKVTGTRKEPKLDVSMTINDEDYYTYSDDPKHITSHDVQSDAISFILAGTFPLTTAQKNDVAADLRSTAGLSLLSGATSLLTGSLSEFLREQTGFINTFELNYGTGSTLGESVDIRLSGVAFNGLWRYGGRIIDDPLNNANFSLMYSVGTIFNENTLRNLMIELERKVESGTLGQVNELKRTNSARMFYRLSF